MASFDTAIEFVLENEGGYEPPGVGDPGGETRFGISKAAYSDLDIKNLTRDQASAIYKRDFWIFDGLTSQRIATKIFDLYVNSKHHAIHVAQLALGYLQVGPIVADGNYGPSTQAHLNAVDETKFMDEYKARLCQMHCEDAAANPAEAGDLLGWLRRDVKG
jgi:lysozyme family protein